MMRRTAQLWHNQGAPSAGFGTGGPMRSGTGGAYWLRMDKPWAEIWKEFNESYVNHQTVGYVVRCVFAAAFLTGVSVGSYRWLEYSMESYPLYRQWLPRWKEITFLERIEQKGTNVWIYRFALPHSYDCTGHEPLSSVVLSFDNNRALSTKRFLTPISHPDQRGIIEFAMKMHSPGDFSLKMRSLQPGDSVQMGPWIKELDYQPNRYKHMGFICANSGITPFLQILVKALDDPEDKTKFSLLYANIQPHTIPFKKRLEEIAKKYPERVKITFAVNGGAHGKMVESKEATEKLIRLGRPGDRSRGAGWGPFGSRDKAMFYDATKPTVELLQSTSPEFEGYIGTVDRDLVLHTMPAPDEEGVKIVCVGPGAMMQHLCGRTMPVLRQTYLEWIYTGLLRNMGYSGSQVYKGASSFPTAIAAT